MAEQVQEGVIRPVSASGTGDLRWKRLKVTADLRAPGFQELAAIQELGSPVLTDTSQGILDFSIPEIENDQQSVSFTVEVHPDSLKTVDQNTCGPFTVTLFVKGAPRNPRPGAPRLITIKKATRIRLELAVVGSVKDGRPLPADGKPTKLTLSLKWRHNNQAAANARLFFQFKPIPGVDTSEQRTIDGVTDANGEITLDYTPASLTYAPGGTYHQEIELYFDGALTKSAGDPVDIPLAPRLTLGVMASKSGLECEGRALKRDPDKTAVVGVRGRIDLRHEESHKLFPIRDATIRVSFTGDIPAAGGEGGGVSAGPDMGPGLSTVDIGPAGTGQAAGGAWDGIRPPVTDEGNDHKTDRWGLYHLDFPELKAVYEKDNIPTKVIDLKEGKVIEWTDAEWEQLKQELTPPRGESRSWYQSVTQGPAPEPSEQELEGGIPEAGGLKEELAALPTCKLNEDAKKAVEYYDPKVERAIKQVFQPKELLEGEYEQLNDKLLEYSQVFYAQLAYGDDEASRARRAIAAAYLLAVATAYTEIYVNRYEAVKMRLGDDFEHIYVSLFNLALQFLATRQINFDQALLKLEQKFSSFSKGYLPTFSRWLAAALQAILRLFRSISVKVAQLIPGLATPGGFVSQALAALDGALAEAALINNWASGRYAISDREAAAALLRWFQNLALCAWNFFRGLLSIIFRTLAGAVVMAFDAGVLAIGGTTLEGASQAALKEVETFIQVLQGFARHVQAPRAGQATPHVPQDTLPGVRTVAGKILDFLLVNCLVDGFIAPRLETLSEDAEQHSRWWSEFCEASMLKASTGPLFKDLLQAATRLEVPERHEERVQKYRDDLKSMFNLNASFQSWEYWVDQLMICVELVLTAIQALVMFLGALTGVGVVVAAEATVASNWAFAKLNFVKDLGALLADMAWSGYIVFMHRLESRELFSLATAALGPGVSAGQAGAGFVPQQDPGGTIPLGGPSGPRSAGTISLDGSSSDTDPTR